jgi:hypothetical protein
MNNPEHEKPETSETELSPEARVILARARRSFGISIGILLLGFMAVGFALVYRAMRDAPPPAMAERISLPSGLDITSAVVVDGTIQIVTRQGPAAMLNIFDAGTGELIRVINILPELKPGSFPAPSAE